MPILFRRLTAPIFTNSVFQTEPQTLQDVCRWCPGEAQQVPQPEGHGKLHFLITQLIRDHLTKLLRYIHKGFGHVNLCQFGGLKGKFGKMIGKKGDSSDCQGGDVEVAVKEEVQTLLIGIIVFETAFADFGNSPCYPLS